MSATIAVTASAADVWGDVLGANGSCTLREAITNINNGAPTYADCANTGAGYGTSDTINIPAGLYTNTIATTNEDLNANGDFDILRSVAIVGAGAGSTFISGGGIDRVFHITGAFIVSISGVTIQSGNPVTGIFNSGGGIFNSGGTLTVTNSTISGNWALNNNGGGIYNGGTLTVTNSTISGNTSNYGGGIENSGTLTVTNTTITSNLANYGGGGISNGGTLTVTNTTISGNTSPAGTGGGIYNHGTATVTNSTIVRNTSPAGTGGGYRVSGAGTATFTNSIVADNGVGLDCVGGVTDSGGNLDSDNSCGTFTQNAAMVQGTGFSALASNGGATQTHALLAGSSAIDAAPTCAGLATDQRGTARPQVSACDIGAYEAIPTGSVTQIVFDPTAPTTLYSALDGYGVYKKVGAGAWTAATTQLTNLYVKALAIKPDGITLFAGTDGGGVFKSSDGGVTWAACANTGTGMTNLNIRSLALTGATLYAGTTAGVFTSADDCSTWAAMSSGLP